MMLLFHYTSKTNAISVSLGITHTDIDTHTRIFRGVRMTLQRKSLVIYHVMAPVVHGAGDLIRP